MKKIFVYIIAASFFGCGYRDTTLNSESNQALQTPTSTAIDFAAVQRIVFEPHCTRCHSQAGGNRGGINLESFATAKAAAQRSNSAVQSGAMPPSGNISAQAKATLANWVQSGTPQFTEGAFDPEPAPIPSPTPQLTPCEDYDRSRSDGLAVNIDSNYFYDVQSQILKRRHDDCHPEHD